MTIALESQAAVVLRGAPTFEDLISPISKDHFLTEFWQNKPCYIPGDNSKFEDLFSWDELNTLLETHHFAYPRFRMSRDGAEVPPKEYMEQLRFTKGNRVDPNGLHRQFAQGATIIVQHADEFCPRLQALSDALEQVLGWHAEVEVIAGSGTSNGLPVHVDANECLVFQIMGAKRWHLYEPTRTAPLKTSKIFPHRYDVFPAPEPSRESAALTFEVTAGDFIYIPRGWWHLVEPLPGPCLSLNPTVYSAAFQDFLRWLVDELSTSDACRASIPEGLDRQRTILKQLESAIKGNLTPEAIARFRTFLSNEMESPIGVNLPCETKVQQALTLRSVIKICGDRSVHVTSDEGSSSFRIRWKAKDVHFSYEHLRIFLCLNDGRCHSVSDVLRGCTSPADRLRGMGFLLELSTQGIIEAEPSNIQESVPMGA